MRHFGIDRAIDSAGYPGSATLPPLQSVLAFLAIKCSSIRRHAADDLWCIDRGPGLFAGLNVLPKTAWLSSYSGRVTRPMNQRLLGALARIWTERGLASDAASFDFTTLPHRGDDDTLKKHWSGTRNRALVGLSTALAMDPDSGPASCALRRRLPPPVRRRLRPRVPGLLPPPWPRGPIPRLRLTASPPTPTWPAWIRTTSSSSPSAAAASAC